MPNMFDKMIALAIAQATKKPSLWSSVSIFGARYLIFVLGAAAVGWVWRYISPTERLSRIFDLFVSVLFAWIITFSLQYVMNRARPYQTLDINPLTKPAIETSSFPSAHATIAFAFASWIALQDMMFGIVFMILAALVGFSRMMIGVHYATDVLAGALVGIIVSSFIFFYTL